MSLFDPEKSGSACAGASGLAGEVRRQYLSGATAKEACAPFGFSERTLRDKAKAEGWRKKDLAAGRIKIEEADEMPPATLATSLTPEALGEEAAALARQALDLVRAGDAKAADAALKAADRLLRIKRKIGEGARISSSETDAAIARARLNAMDETELRAEIVRIATEGAKR